MKKAIILAVAYGAFTLALFSETSAYKLTMSLKVPRVFDNTQSLGYRKNQTQRILAYVHVYKDSLEEGEPTIEVSECYNRTHRVGGSSVTYKDVTADEVMWRYIGSNKTLVFRNVNLKFSLDLNPSYNIGADEPDNTLIITLSGWGNTERLIKGQVTGQIGCGCTIYGHVSPTRTIDCRVSDIVPLSGSFTMRRISVSYICR